MHALYIEISSTWKVKRALKRSRKTIAHLLKFHTRAAQICGFPREFVTLKVAQFVLQLLHLTISMNLMDPALAFSYPYYGSYQYRWTLTPRSNALSSSRCPRTTLANVKFCCQPKDHLKHSKGPCNGYSNSIVVFMDLILIYSVRFWLSSEMAETWPCSQRSKTIVSTRHK